MDDFSKIKIIKEFNFGYETVIHEVYIDSELVGVFQFEFDDDYEYIGMLQTLNNETEKKLNIKHNDFNSYEEFMKKYYS